MVFEVAEYFKDCPEITDELLRDLTNTAAFVIEGGELAEMLYSDVVVQALVEKHCPDSQDGIMHIYNLLTATFCCLSILVGRDDVLIVVDYIRNEFFAHKDTYHKFNCAIMVAQKANKSIKERDLNVNEDSICYSAFEALKSGKTEEEAFKILKDSLSNEGNADRLMNYAYNANLFLVSFIRPLFSSLFSVSEKKRTGANAKRIAEVVYCNYYLARGVIESALERYERKIANKMSFIIGSFVYGHDVEDREKSLDGAIMPLIRVMKLVADRLN